MNKRPSEIIREKILQNGGRAIVQSLTGKPYEIRHCSDGKSFLCDQLPIKPPYTYAVFDVIVDLLERQGGKADKGAGRNAKLGQPRCEETTVVGAIAKYYAGKRDGESVFDPVFAMAAILEWADIAHNERGYLELTANYRTTRG
ncbi:MAG: hypothetical protein IIX64_01050 [Bacteroidales bacterium]|nr:hypothetical protein [Bacteroidales bacterium]